MALIVWDRQSLVTGLLHIALPDSSIQKSPSQKPDTYFADLGVPLLFKKMARIGKLSPNNRLMIKIVGGSTINDKTGFFNIGNRNILAVRKELWKLGMGPLAEDVGGDLSRTIHVSTTNGSVLIKSPKRPDLEI